MQFFPEPSINEGSNVFMQGDLQLFNNLCKSVLKKILQLFVT